MLNALLARKISLFIVAIIAFQFLFSSAVVAQTVINTELAALKPLGSAPPQYIAPGDIPMDEAVPGENPDSGAYPATNEQSGNIFNDSTSAGGSDFTPTPDATSTTTQQELYDTIVGCGCCSTMVIIPSTIVHIILALWVFFDSKKRGANIALWTILTLFFGILGLIFYLVARPTTPPVDNPPHYPPASGQNICPACGTPKYPGQQRCPSCGAES